jgi:hypothetical protein
VENELALDYIPLVEEEEIDAPMGNVLFTRLSRNAARILRVEDKEGRSLKYQLFPNRLQAQAGKVKIVYTYSPEEKTIDGESDYRTEISERLFVYGMAAEYSLAEGELEGASMWDKKYKEAIEAAYRIRPAKRLPARGWL